MTLFFLSGGGRYGNQLINFYHLLSISIEHKLKIYKLNDSSFISTNNYIPFININISKKNILKLTCRNVQKIEYFLKFTIDFVFIFYMLSFT